MITPSAPKREDAKGGLRRGGGGGGGDTNFYFVQAIDRMVQLKADTSTRCLLFHRNLPEKHWVDVSAL